MEILPFRMVKIVVLLTWWRAIRNSVHEMWLQSTMVHGEFTMTTVVGTVWLNDGPMTFSLLGIWLRIHSFIYLHPHKIVNVWYKNILAYCTKHYFLCYYESFFMLQIPILYMLQYTWHWRAFTHVILTWNLINLYKIIVKCVSH